MEVGVEAVVVVMHKRGIRCSREREKNKNIESDGRRWRRVDKRRRKGMEGEWEGRN